MNINPLHFISLGVYSFLTQLLLMRECVDSFYGNEFFIALIFSIWLSGSALGASLYKKINLNREKILLYSYFLFSFLLPLTIYAIRLIKPIFLVPGENPNILLSFLFVFFFVFPFSFISGYQFPALLDIDDSFSVSYSYMLENIGFFVSGMAFYFIFINYNVFLMIAFLFFIIAACIFLDNKSSFKKNISYFLFILGLIILFFNKQINYFSLKPIYGSETLIADIHNISSNIAVTQKEKQNNFYFNGELFAFSDDDFTNEVKTHLPLLFSSKTENILLIGGAISGILSDLMKYEPSRLFYIEQDPYLLELIKPFLKEKIIKDLSKTILIKDDFYRYLEKTNNNFDVVILDIPSPSSLNSNRYYSLEAIAKIKNAMKREGIFIAYLPYSSGYLNENVKNMNLCFYSTLKQIFSEVIFLPDEENIFIASNSKLDINKAFENIGKNKNKFLLLNEAYLKYRLSNDKINEFRNFTNKNYSKYNSFLKPELYIYEILWQIDRFYPSFSKFYLKIKENGFFIFLILLIFSFILNYRKRFSLAFSLMAMSFSLMAMETALIYLFQISFGNLHHKISLIISIIMISISAGNLAYLKRGKSFNTNYGFYNLLFSLLALFSFLFISKFNREIYIFIFSALIGLIFGMGFSAISASFDKKDSYKIYYLDIIGAMGGVFLVSIFLIPSLGFKSVLYFVIILNLLCLKNCI